ncbi:MAG: hypothetical protein ACLPYZ_02545 [Limisphaerales bacterium]
MKNQILRFTLGLALFGAALSASAQNVLQDVFANNGFPNPPRWRWPAWVV